MDWNRIITPTVIDGWYHGAEVIVFMIPIFLLIGLLFGVVFGVAYIYDRITETK